MATTNNEIREWLSARIQRMQGVIANLDDLNRNGHLYKASHKNALMSEVRGYFGTEVPTELTTIPNTSNWDGDNGL